jgi:hypothetical protein
VQWIELNKLEPSHGTRVLISGKTSAGYPFTVIASLELKGLNGKRIIIFNTDGGESYTADYDNFRITHWMEIPAPP